MDTYITNFNRAHNKFSFFKWMHDSPTAVKISQIALLILGAVAMVTFPLSLSVLGIGAAIGIALLGLTLTITSIASWIFTNYVTCKSSDITRHSLKEGVYEGSRLYYQGHVPILELSGTTPFQSGQAHGYLLGPYIYKLKSNFNKIIYGILRQPKPSQLQKMLRKFYKILPEDYQQEMEGLVHGYNTWAKSAGKIKSLMTKDDLMLIHLIPDSKHFHTKKMTDKSLKKSVKFQEIPAIFACACTSILSRDANGKIIFGRNKDWSSFGNGGAESLVVVWKNTGVAVLTVPGMIGAIQGWNRHNLALAMNVCPGQTNTVRGIPAMFLNRLLLDKTKNFAEAEQFAQRHRPLGPYHLTLADKEGQGGCISFYQGAENNDHFRANERGQSDPLLVVNWRYPECKGGSFKSKARTKLLNKYFKKAPSGTPSDQYKLVENALKLRHVNSYITMHSLMIVPQDDQISMSWGNGYAPSQQPQRIKMSSVF